MNTNKFKVSGCYTIGIAGCNKIRKPSSIYGGDRKTKKAPRIEASVSTAHCSSTAIVYGSSAFYNKRIQDTRSALKHRVDAVERSAISQQKAAERAMKDAADAKNLAEMARKNADDREKARQESEWSGALFSKRLQDSLNVIKHGADILERVAISQQKAAELAMEDAADAKNIAERVRKAFDDREKARQELKEAIALEIARTSDTSGGQSQPSSLSSGSSGYQSQSQ